MNETAQVLYDYLRDVWRRPQEAQLDVEALPEDFRALGEGLRAFVESVLEMRAFAGALARGDLSEEPPGCRNELAAPLKALQASLRHMSWQSQQVVKGDYRQRVDFMGEFSEGFNAMTQQLDERRQTLDGQIETIRKQSLSLKRSNRAFVALAHGLPNWIVVVDKAAGERLFSNRAAKEGLRESDEVWQWLRARATQDEKPCACELVLEGGRRVFSVSSHPLDWDGRSSVGYILQDVSAERCYMRELESRANCDNLTMLHSRYYGMQVLNDWVSERRKFVLCFVDLDNLKYVNDSLGHAEGDRYIVKTARALCALSPTAACCRLGGDEFMMLVPDADEEDVERDMAALREALAEGDIPYLRSISYGLVQVDGRAAANPSDLLGLADERMYAFKRAQKRARKAARH